MRIRMRSLLLLLLAATATPKDLNFGYQISTDVASYLHLALDVRDMRAAGIEQKKSIYENSIHNTNGVTLQSLSAPRAEVPLYDLYVSSFVHLGSTNEHDDFGQFDGRPAADYADTLILDLLDLKIDGIEGTGAVVYNVLMEFWASLFEYLATCKRNENKKLRGILDRIVALWIGEDQIREENQKGYLLYNLAENAGMLFGQDDGESVINAEFLEIVISLRDTNNCIDVYDTVRDKMKILIQNSNTVLAQFLIHYIHEAVDSGGESDFVEVFSLGLYPQVDNCDGGIAATLNNVTVSHDIIAETKSQAIAAVQNSLSCLGITCKDVGSYLNGLLPECTDTITPSIAGVYTPTADVRQVAYIDRDIRQIDTLMAANSFLSALDYYQYGWNSEWSLRSIAADELTWSQSVDYALFVEYYKIDDVTGYGFGNDLIVNALEGADPLMSATMLDRRGIVKAGIELMVPYFGMIGNLEASLAACDRKDNDASIFHWDSAAAMFVGSSGKTSVYGVSNELCRVFGTCEPDMSITSAAILASLRGGQSALAANTCAELRQIVNTKIRPRLLVPIIQGLVYNTVRAATADDTGLAKGSLVTYTQMLLPFLDQVSPESAAVVMRNEHYSSLLQDSVPAATGDVADTIQALRAGIAAMTIDCATIGKITISGAPYDLCAGGPMPPKGNVEFAPIAPPTSLSPPTAPATSPTVAVEASGSAPGSPTGSGTAATDLGWGRFSFFNKAVAEQDALFSLDVKDMWFAATPEAASSIYASKSKYALVGLSGYPGITSLQHFSTKASQFMSQDPSYNFFRFALFEDATFDNDASVWAYADAVESLATGKENGNSAKLGSETAVVMEIWMMIVHKLYESVRTCEASNNGAAHVDSAFALWIGQQQEQGKYNSGWSVYALAQHARENYAIPEGEAVVNTDLMELFNEAQSYAKTCAIDPLQTDGLRLVVDNMVHKLSIPLLQQLLFHMSDDSFEYVELYALGFIPQVISVDKAAFQKLRDALFEGFKWASMDASLFSTMGKALKAMRFTCEELGDASKASEKLRGLIEVLCNEMTTTFDFKFVASFETTTSIEEVARIDQDIQQIEIFMRTKSYDLAYDVYRHGRNSHILGGGYLSLQSITRNVSGSASTVLKDFFKSESHADKLMTDVIMNPVGSRYAGATRLQRAGAAKRILQVLTMYLQVLGRFEDAVGLCKSGGSGADDFGQSRVDEAVALYVGSIEGPLSGGSKDGGGQMLFSFAKEMCPLFDTCESHGDAAVNNLLLFAASNMKEGLDDKLCDKVSTILNDKIRPLLAVPLVQGIVYYAEAGESLAVGSDDVRIAEGDIVMETFIPKVNAANETAALVVFENLDFDPSAKSVRDGASVVADSLAAVMPALGVDCSLVGTLKSSGLTVCGGQGRPHVATPVDLGSSLYSSTTYVKDRANIGVDIKEMSEALLLGRVSSAELIYREGKNSAVFNKQGKEVDLRTIASFSTRAKETMANNPLYQTALFSLSDGGKNTVKFLGAPVSTYANSVVVDMFRLGSSTNMPLAAEAAVALNVWMELANELYQAVAQCKDGTLTDEDGIHSIDEAAAYWIGDGNVDSGENGHLLYALAEQLADHFDVVSTGQSRTNTNILRLFHQAKMELSLSNGCIDDSSTVSRVHHIVNKITSQMVVVLMQGLIHFLRRDDEHHRVRIYAYAFVPLVATCSPNTHKFLKKHLVDTEYKELEVDTIITAVRSTLGCFALTCADVGIHETEDAGACQDKDASSSLAGYRPELDVVSFSKIDLDLLEFDVLLGMGAQEAARDLYKNGKHTSTGSGGDGTALSLYDMATSDSRTAVPQFDSYARYFGMNSNYADNLIKSALEGELTESSRVVAVVAAQYMVLPMASMDAMYEAVGACVPDESGRGSITAFEWDKAAALVVGSLEGENEGGSSEGRLLWALSKAVCGTFGTCSTDTPGSSQANDRLMTLWYSGRGAINSGSCDELRKVANEISTVMQIPLIQGSLLLAERLGKRGMSDDRLQAEAYVLTQALLPLIDAVDRDAAKIIKRNFPLDDKPIRDGVQVVANAFANAIHRLGIDCDDIGSSDSIDACSGVVHNSRRTAILISVFTLVGTIAFCVIASLLRSRWLKRWDEKPIFMLPAGEMNHASEILAERINKLNQQEETEPMIVSSSSDDDDDYVRAIESALNGRPTDSEITPIV